MLTSTESLKKPTSSPLNDSGHSNNSFTSNCSAKSRHSNTSNRSKTHHINGDIHIDESKILLQQNRNRLKINKVLDRCSRVNDMLTRISLELRKSQKTKWLSLFDLLLFLVPCPLLVPVQCTEGLCQRHRDGNLSPSRATAASDGDSSVSRRWMSWPWAKTRWNDWLGTFSPNFSHWLTPCSRARFCSISRW